MWRGIQYTIIGLFAVLGGCQQSSEQVPVSSGAEPAAEVSVSSNPGNAAKSANVAPATPEGQGGCTMDSIRKTMQTRKQEVTKCYVDALIENPGLSGRIAINLGIQPGGKLVQRGVFESDLPESVAKCILKNLRGLEFPGVFEKPCGIVYPFVFSSSSRATPSSP